MIAGREPLAGNLLKVIKIRGLLAINIPAYSLHN